MVKFINWFLSQISDGFVFVINLLPDSPFKFNVPFDNKVIESMNYLIPIKEATLHLTVYVSAVLIYYSLRVLLRWLKVASS